MNIKSQIKEKLRKITIIEKLIYLLIIVFVFENLIETFNTVKNSETTNFIVKYFSLSPNANELLSKPYTLLSFGFLHEGFLHFIFNLIILYYIGNLFLDFFNKKKLLTFYFLGSIFGGIFYLLAINYVGYFSQSKANLVGASASITAILVGLATYMPKYEMNFRFIGYVKLWIIAVIWVFLNFVYIRDGINSGGQVAHLGGAFIGFVMAYFNMEKKINFKMKIKTPKKTNLKTVYVDTKGLSNYQKNRVKQNKIDALLDKISNSGYEVLTEEEKEFLNSASKK